MRTNIKSKVGLYLIGVMFDCYGNIDVNYCEIKSEQNKRVNTYAGYYTRHY